MISQARMDALFVVEAIDVSGDRGVEFGIACEAALVGEFSLQGMEEAFHVGVVLALRGRFMETSSCVRSRCPLYRMRFLVSCNGMLGGAPGALLKRPSREAPAGNGTPVGPIRLPEL